MQDENQRPLVTMLVVMGALLAVYYGTSTFFAWMRSSEQRGRDTRHGAQDISVEEGAQREAERRRDAPERQALRRTATIRTDELAVTVDNLGGGIAHAELLDERYSHGGRHLDLVTTTREEYQPLRLELPGVGIPADAVWEIEQESERSVRLRWEGNGLEVVRRFEAGTGPYQIWHTARVHNVGNRKLRLRLRLAIWHYVRRSEEGSSFWGQRSPAVSNGICRHGDQTERKSRNDLRVRHGYRDGIDFVATENVYFVQALAPSGPPAEICGLGVSDRGNVGGEPEGSLFEAVLLYPVVELEPGAQQIWRTLAFIGPKHPAALERAGHELWEVVNLGAFAIIARAFTSLLGIIQGYVGNWGLAIIILTILVRIALFPLTDRSFRSMAQIRKLKPEMDKINELYADDIEKKNAAIMELYRRHGINPFSQLAGCLPVLAQMPVFFALYTSLSTNVELYHRGFVLWWRDLSAPDPYFVLPLMLGGLMWLQQKLTPTAMDPAQAKVMQLMPVIVTLFMLFLPAGLCLYMLTNSVLGIGQQKLNEWRLSREQGSPVATPPAVATAWVNGSAGVQHVSKDEPTKGGGKSPRSMGSTGQRPSRGRSHRG
jgi:YidC/Oxa1 family membrane protein insertase